jgi:hypothetical protein
VFFAPFWVGLFVEPSQWNAVLMLIDSASRAVSHSPGKLTFNEASNFISPNQ